MLILFESPPSILAKQAKKVAENAKVAIRNIRREQMEALKKLEEEMDKYEALQEENKLLKRELNTQIELAKEKGTPVVEKASKEVKKKTLAVLKDVEKKLEG